MLASNAEITVFSTAFSLRAPLVEMKCGLNICDFESKSGTRALLSLISFERGSIIVASFSSGVSIVVKYTVEFVAWEVGMEGHTHSYKDDQCRTFFSSCH